MAVLYGAWNMDQDYLGTNFPSKVRQLLSLCLVYHYKMKINNSSMWK